MNAKSCNYVLCRDGASIRIHIHEFIFALVFASADAADETSALTFAAAL